MLSGFGEWTRKAFKTGVGAITGLLGGLTGQTVTSPSPPSSSTPEAPPDTAPVELIPELSEAIAAMSTTDLLIVLGIGMLAIYGLLTLFRGRR